MIRQGVLVLLGAGSGADAGYPTAADLLESFRDAIDAESRNDEKLRCAMVEQTREAAATAEDDPNVIFVPVFDEERTSSLPSLRKVFEDLWQTYESSLRGAPRLGEPPESEGGSAVFETRTGVHFAPWSFPTYSRSGFTSPSLEGFFAYFDKLLDPEIRAVEASQARALVGHLRRLREIAIELAYRELNPSPERTVDYLSPLIDVCISDSRLPTLVTLNFDLSIELLLLARSIPFEDGFGETAVGPAVPSSARRITESASDHGMSFTGFSLIEGRLALVKAHGSLNWYTVAEGNGEIGWPPVLRENLPYATYQVDPTRFAEVVDQDWQAQAARGGDEDPMLALGVTRKAGAIWLRPHLEFVRSAKTHASPVSVELMSRFAKGLDACRTIVVCGYSWSDAHVNDMILGAAATGANVVNLAYDHDPEPLISLIANKLPTSYEEVLGRIYWIGGGAAAVLEEGSSVLPGDCRDLKSVLEQLRPEWSLVSRIGSA